MTGSVAMPEVVPLVPAPAPAASRAAPVVWSVWLLLLLAALACVGVYGHNVPLWDDYVFLPFLTGDEAPSARWLWEPHNEHRIPLPKLVLLTLLRASGDFRSGMCLSVLLLGGLAAWLIHAARRRRGRTSYADAFFPLMLLHGGHYGNFLWAFEVQFALSTAIAGLLLAVVVCHPRGPGPWATLVVSVCLVFLALCGANGLVYVPALGLWLGAAGWRATWAGGPAGKRLGVVQLALALAAVVLIPLYFRSPTHVLPAAPQTGWWDSLRTGVQFGCMTFGFPAFRYWRRLAPLALGLALLSLAVLAAAWRRRPQERLRVLGLLLLLAGFAGTAAGVAWGRAGLGYAAGLQIRYATLTALAPCCLYFLWELYGPESWARWVRAGLVALAAGIALCSVRGSLEMAAWEGGKLAALEQDVRDGTPVYRLTRRYAPLLQHSHDVVASGLRAACQARIGVFTQLREDPPFEEIPLTPEPGASNQVTWHDGTARGTGRDSALVFSLDRPTDVAGIRLTYTLTNEAGTPAVFEAAWERPGQEVYSEEQSFSSSFLETGPAEQTLTVYVGETIDRFRIRPDQQPFAIRISGIALLVPARDGS